ncbi:MAG TPA: HTTM domain-containing protein, partial [Polyangiales bacterium]|nr:HTTM domain-containing protein [Polyangiales bacterium]
LSFVAALRMSSGSRRAATWLTVLYGGALSSDALMYASNIYLLTLLLGVCCLAPLRAASVSWPRRIGQLTLNAVYLGAGLSKLDSSFLSGRVLEAVLYHNSYYPRLIGWHTPTGFRVLSWLTAFTELSLAFALWHPRTVRYAMIVGVAFHTAIAAFIPVRIFSQLMLASYVLFLPALQLQRAERWLAQRIGPALRAPVYVIAALALYLLDPLAQPRIAGLIELTIALGLHELWRRRTQARARERDSQPETAIELPARSSGRRAKARVGHVGHAVVACYAAFQAFTIVKPWLGFSKFCSWQMFSEVLIMTVETEMLRDGTWSKTVLANAPPRWSSTRPRHHWSSLSEEQFYLHGYQRWLARQTQPPAQVRLRVHYAHFDQRPIRLFIGPE